MPSGIYQGNKKGVRKNPHTKEWDAKIASSLTGRKLSPDHIKSLKEGHKGVHAGDKNGRWKGDDIKYRGLHLWVQLVLGKPDTCLRCGTKGTGHRMHWANVSGSYKREKEDWLRLCPKCHKAFDKKEKAY